jgi:hypothetical protein
MIRILLFETIITELCYEVIKYLANSKIKREEILGLSKGLTFIKASFS